MRKNSHYIYLFLLPLMLLSMITLQISAQSKRKNVKPRVQKATVIVDENGFWPAALRLRKGVPAQLAFLRQTEKSCANSVIFNDYGIRRELPLNKAVIINFTPHKTGEFTFACGMNMVRGKLIIQ